jgi:YHS domain-containing protein
MLSLRSALIAGILARRKKEEVFGLNRLLHSLIVTSVVAVVVLAANNAAGASEDQALDPTRNNAGNEPILLAQNAAPKEEKSTSTTANVDGKGVILKGYDAVAYFKQGKPLKGNPEIASTYQGVTYLFASEANKADFDKDPTKYVPQYGAFCAYGVANGVITGTEGSKAFTIYKGKLYLGGDQDALKSFKTDIDENIEKGDAYWRQIPGL